MTVYALSGDLGRVFSLEAQPESFLRPDVLSLFSNGDWLAHVPLARDGQRVTETGTRWAAVALLRYSGDGRAPVVLGEADGVACAPDNDGECSFMAYGATRNFWLHDDQIYKSRPDRNEMLVFDAEHNLRTIIRGASPLRPVTEAMRSEFRDAVLAGSPARADQRREYMDQASFADSVPAFAAFLVDGAGNLWTQEYRVELAPFGYSPAFPPRTAPIRWTIYDPQGVQLGDVEVPFGLRVSEIGEDYVLGVHRDELGVERVRMYDLAKP